MAFGRKWKLYISQPNLEVFERSGVPYPKADLTIHEDAILLSDPLHIDAEISNSSDVSGEQGAEITQIDLYNLSDDTLKKIKGGEILFLYGGYEQDKDLPLVYTGWLKEVEAWSEGVDRVTRLHTTSIDLAVQTLQFNRSYRAGTTTYYDILNDITEVLNRVNIPMVISHEYDESARNMMSSLGIYTEVLERKGWGTDAPFAMFPDFIDHNLRVAFHRPYAFRGNVFKALSMVCKDIGFIWFVVRGVVHVHHKKYPILQEYRTINPFNIVGNMKPYTKTNRADFEEDDEQGVELSVFLDPTINLNTYIKLSKEGYEGTWQPTEVKHQMSYQGGDWLTTLRLLPSNLSNIPRDLGRIET